MSILRLVFRLSLAFGGVFFLFSLGACEPAGPCAASCLQDQRLCSGRDLIICERVLETGCFVWNRKPCLNGRACGKQLDDVLDCLDTPDTCNPACAAGQTCVKGICQTTASCNPACPVGQACIDGTCQATSSCNPACPSGTICVSGICQPTGTCNPACASGQTCVSGTCQPTGGCNPACPAGQTCVSGTCQPTGGCNPACPTGQTCVSGVCQPTCKDNCTLGQNRCDQQDVQICGKDPTTGCLSWFILQTCAAGQVCFQGGCQASGSCNPPCPSGQVCISGACKLSCQDVCQDGQSQCSGSDIQSCQTLRTGCTDWITIQTCPSGETCVSGACQPVGGCNPACPAGQTCTNGTCQPTCTNACQAGQKQCDSGVPQDCQADATGCLKWVSLAACPAGQACAAGTCQPTGTCNPACPAGQTCVGGACQPTCTNACQTGQKRCTSGVPEACQADATGCLKWVAQAPCLSGHACTNGTCQPTCPNPCPSGQKRCTNGIPEACAADAAGCLKWVSLAACPAGQTCTAGTCQSSCTNACQTGQNRCTSGVPEACQADATGCLKWVSLAACPAGQTCTNGTCQVSCQNPCTAGQRQCAGNTPQVCQADATGCLVWASQAACSAAQICSQGQCVAPTDPSQRTATMVCTKWLSDFPITSQANWTGTSGQCTPGTISEASLQEAIRRVNLYRWLVGLPPVAENTSLRGMMQDCAVLQANNDGPGSGVNAHSPPSSWKCYTQSGAQGSGSSNLSWGVSHPADTVPQYMADRGTPSLGHRLWIISKGLGSTAFGYAQGSGRYRHASCMHTFDRSGSAVADYTAFPSPGPFPMAALSDRFGLVEDWSFTSSKYNTSGVTSVQVVRTSDNDTQTLTVVKLGGFGGTSGISFKPRYPKAGETYTVKIGTLFSYTISFVNCP